MKVPDGERKKLGNKPGHPGAFRQVPEEIDETVVVTLDHCPQCHGPVEPQQMLTQYIEELPPIKPIVNPIVPQFTATQAAAGKTSYNSSCAVCHGNTLTNGTMATPLAGQYFRKMWTGRSVRACTIASNPLDASPTTDSCGRSWRISRSVFRTPS